MPADTPKGYVHFFDDFIQDTINLDLWTVNGDDGTAGAINVAHNGTFRMTGDGTDTDIENIYSAVQWRADAGGFTVEIRATLVTSIADGETFIGISDASADEEPFSVSTTDVLTSTSSDGAGFCYTGAGTADWKAVSTNADADGTVTRYNVGGATTPVVGTYQTFKLAVNADGDVDFYIDGVWHYREDLAVAPTTLHNVFVSMVDGGTARSMDIDYIEVWAGRR
jgi:hypothetical protein